MLLYGSTLVLKFERILSLSASYRGHTNFYGARRKSYDTIFPLI